MRLFIGIPYSDMIKNRFVETQNQIRPSLKQGKMVPKNNFHLTLRFIGEIEEGELAFYKNMLTFLQEIPAFTMRLGGIQSFLKQNKHLIYMDVIENHNALFHLVNELDTHFPTPRKEDFKPHTTLLREGIIKDGVQLSDFKLPEFVVHVDQVTLFLSSQIQNVLTYTPLASVHLKS